MDLSHLDRTFLLAVDMMDAGNENGLNALLTEHPELIHQRVRMDGPEYFAHPSLLEFIAENPVRTGRLPANALAIASLLLDFGPDQPAMDKTLTLVATGRVSRECGLQTPLLELLCARGSDPNAGARPAAAHEEVAALQTLIRLGASVDLPISVAIADYQTFSGLIPKASQSDRHLALAFAAQYGHVGMLRLLLEAGENPSRYNPPGAHSHSTPLHQAAWHGHEKVVEILRLYGARLDLTDKIWQGTPADWARHANHKNIEIQLRQ